MLRFGTATRAGGYSSQTVPRVILQTVSAMGLRTQLLTSKANISKCFLVQNYSTGAYV